MLSLVFTIMKLKTVRWIAFLLLVCCLAILSRFILFKNFNGRYGDVFNTSINTAVIKEGIRTANFKPFSTIQLFSKSRRLRTEYKVDNLGGNIIGFLPVGFLLCIIIRHRFRYGLVVFTVFSISLCFEIIQLLTGWGVFDVDDLILNTFGGLLGIFFFSVFRSIAPDIRQ